MKKSILLIVLIITCSRLVFAQAPQGLNYQAVAYNGSGVPVPNQLLGVRLSILDGSATGTLVYQETQGPTTDNTGLFSIVIGNGTVVSGTFNTINWGNGSKWLKTEIDITGGTSYVVMGTTQFMSVPYALYANTGGLGSPSFTNPDGFEHPLPVIIPMMTNYTVPAGKNLYIPSAVGGIAIDGDTLNVAIGTGKADSRTFVGASENSVVYSKFWEAVCFLVDKKVDWRTIDVNATSFTVPANKQFVIINISSLPMSQTCQVTINGGPLSAYISLTNSILDAGDIISTTGCIAVTPPAYYIINGYFKDR